VIGARDALAFLPHDRGEQAMDVQTKMMTVAEFEALPEDGSRHELVRGELLEMPPPKPIHGLIMSGIFAALFSFVTSKKLGLVIMEAGIKPFPNEATIYGVDIGYFSADRVAIHSLNEYLPMAPDIAVEVISPGNTEDEIDGKIADYLRGGSQLVWIVYPKAKHVFVYRADGTFQIVDLNGALDGGNVLHGFTLPVKDIFQLTAI
jgi:Uma2 family endonuclease